MTPAAAAPIVWSPPHRWTRFEREVPLCCAPSRPVSGGSPDFLCRAWSGPMDRRRDSHKTLRWPCRSRKVAVDYRTLSCGHGRQSRLLPPAFARMRQTPGSRGSRTAPEARAGDRRSLAKTAQPCWAVIWNELSGGDRRAGWPAKAPWADLDDHAPFCVLVTSSELDAAVT